MLEEVVKDLMREKEILEHDLIWVIESELSPSDKKNRIVIILGELYDKVMKISVASNYLKENKNEN